MGNVDKSQRSLTSQNGQPIGWLQKYLVYTQENEAPERFHLWSALTVLAHVLGRQVWIDRGYYKSYPGQIMTFIIGPSGVRKSTAINIATRLLKEIPSVRVVADKLTVQALIQNMDRGMTLVNGIMQPADAVVFLQATELAVLLPKQQYVEELIPMLTKIADAEDHFEYSTKTAGTVSLTNPLATFLAASTPDWLISAIPENAFGGGFMSRILFVFEKSTTRCNPRPERNPTLDRLFAELAAELLWISNNLTGPYHWDVSAIHWWDLFYRAWQSNPNIQIGGFIGGYFGRRPEHLLRVASVIAVSQRRELVLTEGDFVAADALLQDVEKSLPVVFSQYGATGLALQQQKILEKIQTTGQISKSDLYRHFWRSLTKEEFELALDGLLAAELINPPSLTGRKIMLTAAQP